MLTFLRKIRRSLIESGSARRYLLYAIGEIALVVIGILIALQINNWNEWHKERDLEVEALQELADNIKLNIEVFEDYVSSGRYTDYSTDYVLDVLNENIPYSDSIDRIINVAIYQRNDIAYSTIAYESLKNENLNLIRNKSLKKAIISLFELSYPNLDDILEWENEKEIQDYMDRHFYPTPLESGMAWEPYDFSVVLNDNYFKSLIAKVRIQRNFYIWQVDAPLNESKVVLQLINDELEEMRKKF